MSTEQRSIYVASSWRNAYQPNVVLTLREAGHEVYDFRHPMEGNDGFRWSDIDPQWEGWDPDRYRLALQHPVAQHGFGRDFGAMERADTCVLVLPSGRSAHIEAGYFVGAEKDLFIYMPERQEPELMYLMAPRICTSLEELLAALAQDLQLDSVDRPRTGRWQ